MIITWVLYWPETLPPASAFPAAEAGAKGCLGCQTQPQIRAGTSGIQMGWVGVSWSSGLCEGLDVFFCFFVIKKKKKQLLWFLFDEFVYIHVFIGVCIHMYSNTSPVFSLSFFPLSYFLAYLTLFLEYFAPRPVELN